MLLIIEVSTTTGDNSGSPTKIRRVGWGRWMLFKLFEIIHTYTLLFFLRNSGLRFGQKVYFKILADLGQKVSYEFLIFTKNGEKVENRPKIAKKMREKRRISFSFSPG